MEESGYNKHVSSESDSANNAGQYHWKDAFRIDRTMLPYKFFYLLYIGAGSSIISFMPLQMKQLGLSPSRIGLASAVRPFSAAISTAVIGAVSDRIGYRRGIMVCLLVLMTISGIIFATIRSPEEASCDVAKDQMNNLDTGMGINRVRRSLRSNEHEDHSNCNGIEWYRLRRNVAQPAMNKTVGSLNSSNQNALLIDRSWQYNQQDLYRIFIEVLLVGCIFEMVVNPGNMMLDAATMAALKEADKNLADYSRQRTWGNLSWDLSAFMTGILLQVSRHNIMKCGIVLVNANYVMVLVPFGVLMAGSLVCVTQLRLSYKEPNANWKHLKILLTPHYIIVLSAILFFGICNGVVWGFLFWHLENIGATHGMLSIVTLFQAASQIPSGYLSSFLIRHIGYWNSINIGFFMYTVRFIWIYFITNPWWIVPMEFLNGFAFSQTWNVLIAYISKSIPTDLFVTVCGFCASLYFGIGVALGYLITGYMVESLGGAATFGFYGGASLLLSIFFGVLMRVVDVPDIEDESSDNEMNQYSDSTPLTPVPEKNGEKVVLLPTAPVQVVKSKTQIP